MIRGFLWAIVQQIFFLILLGLTPVICFILLGKEGLVDLFMKREYLSLLQGLVVLSLKEALTLGGTCLISWAVVYHQLPYSFSMISIPFFGLLDRFLAKLSGIIGLVALYLANA